MSCTCQVLDIMHFNTDEGRAFPVSLWEKRDLGSALNISVGYTEKQPVCDWTIQCGNKLRPLFVFTDFLSPSPLLWEVNLSWIKGRVWAPSGDKSEACYIIWQAVERMWLSVLYACGSAWEANLSFPIVKKKAREEGKGEHCTVHKNCSQFIVQEVSSVFAAKQDFAAKPNKSKRFSLVHCLRTID